MTAHDMSTNDMQNALAPALQFNRNGDPVAPQQLAPTDANGLMLVWKENTLVDVAWTQDGQVSGLPIEIPQDANAVQFRTGLPLSPDFITPEEFLSSLSLEARDELMETLKYLVAPPSFEEELARVTKALRKNLPTDRPPELTETAKIHRIAASLLSDLARASYAEATASFAYQEASKIRIVNAGNVYMLVNHMPDGPNVLMFKQDATEEDKKIIWFLGFIGELLLGLLAAAGIKVKGGNAVMKVAKMLWENKMVKTAIRAAIAALTATTLYEVLKTVYDQGLLGTILKELADLGFWGILHTATMLGLNLIPGAGQLKLTIALGALAVELGIKLKDAPVPK